MPYGEIKVDNITFTNVGADQATTVSGIYRAITSGVTVTGTISGATIQGATVSGTAGIFGVGSAAAPSISFTSDPNTGIYSPAADTLAFVEGGVEVLRIDSSGRVGIGTSSPGSLLDVRFVTNPITDNGNGVDALRVWTNSALAANSGGAISLGGTATSAPFQVAFGQIAGRKENATSANYAGYLQFATNDAGGTMSEWMRIDSSGKVGIGTTSPVASLHVENAIPTFVLGETDGTSTHNQSWLLRNSNELQIQTRNSTGTFVSIDYNSAGSSTGATSHQWYIQNSERLRIDSSGNVGIGTASPAYRLDVQGGNARIYAGGGGSSLEIGTGATGNQFAFIDLVGDTTYSDYGLRLIRDNAGANSNSILRHRGTGALNITAEDAGSVILATQNTERLRVDSSGRVGIGTSSPTYPLHVVVTPFSAGSQGAIRIGESSNGAAFGTDVGLGFESGTGVPFSYFATGSDSNSNLRINVAGTERLRIDSSGNVGIGTTVPEGPLEVSKAASGTLNGEVLLQRIRSNASNSVFLDTKSRRHTAGSDWFGVGLRLQHQVDVTLMGFLEFNSTNNSQDVALGTSGAYPIVFKVNNTENARFDSSGRLGIGTSSPGAALDVSGNIRLSADSPNIEFNNGGAMVYGPAANTLAFATGGGPASPAERFRIGSAGQLGIGGANYGTTGQSLISQGSSASPTWGSSVVSGTSVASTSGTAIDFTGIPSWVKRVTVMFDGVSTNGSASVMVQLGTSSSFETASYAGSSSFIAFSTAGARAFTDVTTAGFFFFNSVTAADLRDGQLTLLLLDSATNKWSANGAVGTRGQLQSFVSGSKALSGTLTRVRVTTTNGTDTFDAGAINILYE